MNGSAIYKVMLTAQLMLASLVVAAEEPAIRLLALDGPLSSGVPEVIERLSGEPMEVPLLVLAQAGQMPQAAADVYLDVGELGVPLHKGVALKLTRDPSSHAALLEGTLSLPSLEENQKSVLLRVVLRTRADDQAAWLRLGQFRLRMVPQVELKMALALFDDTSGNSGEYRLGVFGAAKGLREMLKASKTPFEDFGKELPVRIEPRMLVVGDFADANQTPLPVLEEGASLLIVRIGSHEVVSIEEKITNRRVLTVVNAARVEDWRHSAFLQRLLTRQIQQHQSKL